MQIQQCPLSLGDPYGNTGNTGFGQLAIDVALHDPGETDRTLLISGGLHGVEGFFGSAVQLRFLQSLREVGIPNNVRIALAHCLNPWGLIHSRRTDDTNRDLNRNFLLQNEEYCGSPRLYAQLNTLLNPQDVPLWDPFLPRAMAMIMRHGFTPLKRAIAQGQYDFPHGLFFGGHHPANIMGLMRSHLMDWIGPSSQIMHLDLHTGLGKSMTWKLLPDGEFSAQVQQKFQQLFGHSSFVPASQSDGGYGTRGGMGKWCASLFDETRKYDYACVEFGTYPSLRVLRALRMENCCHHLEINGQLASTDKVYVDAKTEIREVFCPSSDRWRIWAVEEGNALITKILRQLTTS